MTSIILSPDAAPVTPEEGEIYYDSSDDKLKVRDASGFREIVSENSSGEIAGTFSGTISSSATVQGNFGGLDVANSIFTGTVGQSAVIHSDPVAAALPNGTVTNMFVRKVAIPVSSGAPGNADVYINTTSSEIVTSRTSTASTTVPSFTAKQGHTYLITFNFYATVSAAGTNPGNMTSRTGNVKMYISTTSRSQGQTGGGLGDDKLAELSLGRIMNTATTSSTPSEVPVTLTGAFYHSTSDTTMYYYFTSYQGSVGRWMAVFMNAQYPLYETVQEIKGNVFTTHT